MKLAIIAALILTITSCTTFQRKKQPIKAQPSATAQLKKIEKLVLKKKYTTALKQLDQLILETVSTDVSDDAHILAGEVSLKLSDHDMAYKYFLGVVNSDVYSPRESYAITKASESLLKLGRYDEALSLIQKGLSYRNIPNEEKVSLYQLKFL